MEGITVKAKSLLGEDGLTLGSAKEYIIWLERKPTRFKFRDDQDIVRVTDARLESSGVSRGSWVILSGVDENVNVEDISFEIDDIDRSFQLRKSDIRSIYSSKLFPLPKLPSPPDPIYTFSRYEIEEKVEVMELPSWADYSLAIKTNDGWKVIYIDVDQL